MLLETERLVLRPLKSTDASELYRLHSDPLVVRLTTCGLAMTRAQSDERLQLYLREWREFGFGFFMVYEKQDNGSLCFSGRCGLRDFNGKSQELGYCFFELSSGRGLATEAARQVISDAVARLELEKLVALVRPTNPSSQRIMGKLGFTYLRIMDHRDTAYRYYERDLSAATVMQNPGNPPPRFQRRAF
jgi:RimJ/RimL family protein N-acetyltransferase